MKITIIPKSILGRWSVSLATFYVLFFVLSEIIIGSGTDYNVNLAYTLTAVDAGIGLATFVTGLISILKSKERAFPVFLTTAIGLYGIIGGIGSLLGLAK